MHLDYNRYPPKPLAECFKIFLKKTRDKPDRPVPFQCLFSQDRAKLMGIGPDPADFLKNHRYTSLYPYYIIFGISGKVFIR
jgi:hypothetical protein